MYYLKYRPRTVGELDNSHVRQALANILRSSKLPHAFLFVGPKGMGKTSTARIFAKAVNCQNNFFSQKNDSIEPCNQCKNCQSIDLSSNSDVIELDAASNRGIEEIRKLIREAVFAPINGRYRIFIIDEAHMITTEAFNALLKTLEEPPPSIIFILATTNEEKVPVTIQSRCVRLAFGSAKAEDIKHQLKRIIKAEGLKVDAELIEFIVRFSDHSFRDAAKLLEELVIQDKLNLEKARQYLGIRAKNNLLFIMKNQSLADTLNWVDEFVKNGGNVKYILDEMLEELRKQLLIKSKAANISDIGANDLGFDLAEISLLLRLFTEAYSNLRISPIPSIPLEIAVVDFYNHKSVKSKQ